MPRGDGKKNHSVNRERSNLHRKRAAKLKHARAEQQKRQRDMKEGAGAYWSGEQDEHPLTDWQKKK